MRRTQMLSLILCAALLAMAFAGCGGPASQQSTQSQTSQSASQAPASGTEEPAEPADGGYVSASGIPISAPGELPITQETVTLSVFIQQLGYMLTDVTTNSFTKELEEMTNVHLDMTVAPADSYKEKLNLVLASGEYPEVVMSGGIDNAALVRYGTGENIFIPLNDLIDTHGFHIKERFAAVPEFRDQMTTPDGNIYGIPSSESMVGHGAVSYKMWMNTAWLEKLNLDVPTTTEDFRAVLEAFKTQDPNGNGQADEIPLTGAINTWAADPYLNLINAFGYYHEDLYQLKNDTFSTVADAEYFKEAMDYLAGLYKDGLLDPASLTQNDQQMAALGNNPGDAIVGAATCGHLGMLVSINDTERATQYNCAPPLQSPGGYRGIPFAKNLSVNGGVFLITDKCKNPEIAIKLADLLCEESICVRLNVGIKGTHWDDADAGTFGMDGKTPATRKYLSNKVSGEGAVENDVWENTGRLLEPFWKGTFQVEGDIRDPSNYEAYLFQETMALKDYAADVQNVPPLFMDEDMSARISQLKQPLQDYVKSSIVEFVTGAKSPDADWQTYLDGLSRLNYSEYIELLQKAYDAQ